MDCLQYNTIQIVRFLQSYESKNNNEIIYTINNGVGLFSQAQLYGLLLKREGLDKEVNGSTSKITLLLRSRGYRKKRVIFTRQKRKTKITKTTRRVIIRS